MQVALKRIRWSFARTLAALAVCLGCVTSAAAQDLPNIVIIYADDLGCGDLSCYNPQAAYQTPRLDRMAKEGIRFTDAHSPSTICSPSISKTEWCPSPQFSGTSAETFPTRAASGDGTTTRVGYRRNTSSSRRTCCSTTRCEDSSPSIERTVPNSPSSPFSPPRSATLPSRRRRSFAAQRGRDPGATSSMSLISWSDGCWTLSPL